MHTDLLGDANIFGDRVELRSVKQNDFDLLFRWLNNPEIYRWWGGIPIDPDVVKQKYLGLQRPQIDGYIIEATGIPIGYAQRHQAGESGGSIDLFLVPEMRGRGYGGAAVRALVRYLTLREGWKRIAVDPQKENILAHRFWRKLGFVQTEEITSEGNFVLVYGGSSHQRPDGEYL